MNLITWIWMSCLEVALTKFLNTPLPSHCVKSVQIRSFFWSVFGHFSRSGLIEMCLGIWWRLFTKKKPCRRSHRRCSVRKGDLRNFAKFTGKHLRQSLFFNKVAGLRPNTSGRLLLNFAPHSKIRIRISFNLAG